MDAAHSDALVFFGITGDLAFKKIFPSLQAMVKRGLGDAMAGDATLFARQDYVEEAWRIVDPYLKSDTPVYDYEPKSWGPAEVEQMILPAGGWHKPTVGG